MRCTRAALTLPAAFVLSIAGSAVSARPVVVPGDAAPEILATGMAGPPQSQTAGTREAAASEPLRLGIDESRWPLDQWLADRHLAFILDEQEESAAEEDVAASGNFAIASFADAVSNTESLDDASVAYNPRRGEYLVVWHAWVRETNYNIYGRRLAADGSAIGNAFLICGAPRGQIAPTAAYEPNADQFWVSWTDFREGSTADVYLRRVSTTGTLLGSEIVPNSGAADAFAARIAAGAGRCTVAWASDPHDGNSHVLARGYDSSGNSVSTILLLSEPVGMIGEPDICFNGEDSRFFVVWHEAHNNYWDIWAHHLTWDLYGLGRFAVASATGHQQQPRISYSPGADSYLVVWQDGRSMQTWDIYGQAFSRAGTLLGGALAIVRGQFHDMLPAVAGLDSYSDFLVAYHSDISGASQYQVFASRVTGGGAIGNSFPVRIWYNVRIRPGIAQRGGTNECLVAWTDSGTATQPDIQAQRTRIDGALQGSLVVVSRGRKGQEAPAAAQSNARNEALVTWADYRSGADYDLYARRVVVNGLPVGQEIVLGNAADLYGEPAVAHDPRNDEYLVVWQEVHSQSSGYEIYARRVGGGGDLRGGAFLVSTGTATENEGRPHVAYNQTTGEHLVVWHAFTSGRWRVWGQRVGPAGALLGGNFIVSASTGDCQNPRVACSPSRSEFLVVWQDGRNTRWDIYGQRLNSTGGALGGNLAISTATGNKGRCDVAHDSVLGGYLVVWGDTRTGADDIYGQRVGADGTLGGGNFAVSATTAAEIAPSAAFDPVSRQFLTGWWQLHTTTDYDLYAVEVPGSSPPSAAGYPVCTATETQSQMEIVQNATSGWLLMTWQDFRAGSYDIYGQWWNAAKPRPIRRHIHRR